MEIMKDVPVRQWMQVVLRLQDAGSPFGLLAAGGDQSCAKEGNIVLSVRLQTVTSPDTPSPSVFHPESFIHTHLSNLGFGGTQVSTRVI